MSNSLLSSIKPELLTFNQKVFTMMKKGYNQTEIAKELSSNLYYVGKAAAENKYTPTDQFVEHILKICAMDNIEDKIEKYSSFRVQTKVPKAISKIYDDMLLEFISYLFDQGYTQGEVSRRIHLNHGSISRITKKYNLSLPPKRNPVPKPERSKLRHTEIFTIYLSALFAFAGVQRCQN